MEYHFQHLVPGIEKKNLEVSQIYMNYEYIKGKQRSKLIKHQATLINNNVADKNIWYL